MSTATAQKKRMVTEYPNREEWLASRKGSIGASDVAAILGLDKYRPPEVLFAEKMGRYDRGEAGLPARVGLYMEPFLAEEYERETGRVLFDPGPFTVFEHPDYPFWRCTPDRLVLGDAEDIAVEMKTISELVAMQVKDGDVPLKHMIQLQAQLAVLGFERGDLACLVGNRKFEIFPFERHEKLIASITREVVRFHERLLNDDPPPISGAVATTEMLKNLHPNDNGETVQLSAEANNAAQELENYKVILKDAETNKRGAENRLKAEIGDATYGEGDGVKYSLKSQTRKGSIRVEAEAKVRLEANGIKYKETAESTCRVLRAMKVGNNG